MALLVAIINIINSQNNSHIKIRNIIKSFLSCFYDRPTLSKLIDYIFVIYKMHLTDFS